MAKARQRITVPDRRKGTSQRLALPSGLTAKVRTSDRTGLTSVTLAGYGDSVVLRERSAGAIQMRAPWIPTILGQTSDRASTGVSDWRKAIRVGKKLLEIRLGRQDELEASRHDVLRIQEAVELIREHDLIPGDPKTETGRKAIRGYELVLDLAVAILHENPPLPLNQTHATRFYEARAVDPDSDTEDNSPGFEWPAHITRKRLPRVKPQTVQKNLEDLRTALRWLRGKVHHNGELIQVDAMTENIDIGNHQSEGRDTAGPYRAGLVLSVADEATELIRTEGYPESQNRTLESGKVSTRETHTRLRKIVPGTLKAMFTQNLTHPVRPKAIRNVLTNNVALDRPSLVRLLRRMPLTLKDWSPPDSIFDLWPHGAILYLKEYSKLRQVIMLPLTEHLNRIMKEYLSVREHWLASHDVESEWLYPAPRTLKGPINETDQGSLLKMGEAVARERLPDGVDPDEYIPLFKGTLWYAYRRAWKANRNELGWEGRSAAEYAGDWGYASGPTADSVYAGVSARLISAVIEGKTFHEAIAQLAEQPTIQAGARVAPIDPASLG